MEVHFIVPVIREDSIMTETAPSLALVECLKYKRDFHAGDGSMGESEIDSRAKVIQVKEALLVKEVLPLV